MIGYNEVANVYGIERAKVECDFQNGWPDGFGVNEWRQATILLPEFYRPHSAAGSGCTHLPKY